MDLRPHPLYIWYDARKWIWLLLIPVLRALFSPRDAVYILLSSIRDVGILSGIPPSSGEGLGTDCITG